MFKLSSSVISGSGSANQTLRGATTSGWALCHVFFSSVFFMYESIGSGSN